MRMLFTLLLLPVLLAACGNASQQRTDQDASRPAATDQETMADHQDEEAAERVNTGGDLGDFAVRSAKIVFEYSGIQEGMQTMYIADYGNTVVLLNDWIGLGDQPEKKTIIWKDGMTTIYDHLAQSTNTFKLRVKDTEPSAVAITNEADLRRVGYEIMPEATVAGKHCKVYHNEQLQATYYIWKKVDLKVDNESLGSGLGLHKEAISVEEGIEIPASVLEAPAGYQ